MEINITNSYTELYVGGGWITENYPTNFHTFSKRRILLKTESENDYLEITDDLKAALELSDAEWIEPSKSFIELWNIAAGEYGCYNEKTGYFELNGLTDLTYKLALDIYDAGAVSSVQCSFKYAQLNNIRTNLPFKFGGTLYGNSSAKYILASYLLQNNKNIEVFNVNTLNENKVYLFCLSKENIIGTDAIFCTSPKLKKIIGVIDIGLFLFQYPISKFLFKELPELTSVKLVRLRSNINLSTVPKIDEESLLYMINNRFPLHIENNSLIVTLHPDTFARLTDELIAAATEKQIQFATI